MGSFAREINMNAMQLTVARAMECVYNITIIPSIISKNAKNTEIRRNFLLLLRTGQKTSLYKSDCGE